MMFRAREEYRCTAVTHIYGHDIPCSRLAGHVGLHESDGTLTGNTYQWGQSDNSGAGGDVV